MQYARLILLSRVADNMKTIVALLCVMVAGCQAAQVDIEWVLPYSGDQELCVAPGDVVNFVYVEGHNVEAVSKEAFDACQGSDSVPVPGPIMWAAPNEESVTYVICGVAHHCDAGQKIAITTSHHC